MRYKQLSLVAVLLLSGLFLAKHSYAQPGVTLSYSANNSLGFNFFINMDKNVFVIGYSKQQNGQKNTVVSRRKDNYGLTPTGKGDFYSSLDLGYGRYLSDKVVLLPEISFGSVKYFTNYSDRRFTDNGYSLINETEAKIGFGLNIAYHISRYFDLYGGIHSVKIATFGFRVRIPTATSYN